MELLKVGKHIIKDESLIRLKNSSELIRVGIDERAGHLWLEYTESKLFRTMGQRDSKGWSWGASLNQIEEVVQF